MNIDLSSDGESNDDQLAFNSRNIRNMWKKRNGTIWKGSKKPHRERKDKEKSSIICFECKKPGHFKLECLDLDKSAYKKKYFKSKDKKVLMKTWEELDDTLFDVEIEEEEETNLCLTTNTASKGSDSKSDEEVNINNL